MIHILIGRPKPESSVGIVKSVFHLSVNQGLLGHNVDILSIRRKQPFPPTTLGKGVINHTYNMCRNRFSISIKLKNFLISNKRDIDIVHFHSGYHPEYWTISRLLGVLGIPYIISPRGCYQKYANRKNYIKKLIYKYIFEISFYSNAAGIHALNRSESKDIIEYGVPQNIIFTIPNGVDLSYIPCLDDYEITNKSPKDSSRFNILYCGRIDILQKGLDILVNAMSKINKDSSVPEYHLLIMGPDWKDNKKRLLQLVERLGLENFVHFIGPHYGKEKYKIFAAADVFVLLSRSEGMPTSILEAMAFGMPCILTRETNIVSEAAKVGACVFVDSNPTEIADTIKYLSTDKKLLSNMGKAASLFVSDNYKYDVIATQMCNAYQQVLGRLK